MNQIQNIKDGLAIYDKLSEIDGIQDIIKDKLKSYLRKHRSIICHNQMIDEMNRLHISFIGDISEYRNNYRDEDSSKWTHYIIYLVPSIYGSIWGYNYYMKLLSLKPGYCSVACPKIKTKKQIDFVKSFLCGYII